MRVRGVRVVVVATSALLAVAAFAACVGQDATSDSPAPPGNDAATTSETSSTGGDGSTTPTPTPDGGSPDGGDAATGPIQPVQVAAGLNGTCTVLSDGTVACWGKNEELQSGVADGGALVKTPTRVAGITNAVEVCRAGTHACARLATGRLVCWGKNTENQLSVPLGTSGVRTASPVEVEGFPPNTEVTKIACGQMHTCAVTKAAEAYCWGNDPVQAGHIGVQPSGGSAVPMTKIVIPTIPAGQAQWVDIQAGATHTCGRTIAHGGCWGDNYYGHSGKSNIGAFSSPPEYVLGVASAKSFSLGSAHTCVLTSANAVMCFGNNDSGQRGPVAAGNVYQPLAVPGWESTAGVTELSVGGLTTCVRLASGVVQCVGFNREGQLGRDSADNSSSVIAPVTNLNDALSVSVGFSHACALRSAGGPMGTRSIACWGNNLYGELGTGDEVSSRVPVAVKLTP